MLFFCSSADIQSFFKSSACLCWMFMRVLEQIESTALRGEGERLILLDYLSEMIWGWDERGRQQREAVKHFLGGKTKNTNFQKCCQHNQGVKADWCSGILQWVCTKRLTCQCGSGPSIYIPVHGWILSLCNVHKSIHPWTAFPSWAENKPYFCLGIHNKIKSWNKPKPPQLQGNQTKHLHILMDMINVSALLNLAKGYLTSFCLTVVAHSHREDSECFDQGWWAHNWDQKLAQNLPRNKKLFSAEVRLSRKGQGRKEFTISNIKWKNLLLERWRALLGAPWVH